MSHSTRFSVLFLFAFAAFLGMVQPAAAAVNPTNIMSNDNMRAANSMSQAQIQAFLETQTGPLKSLVTTDHTGVKRKASTIIWRASQKWQISPKVMLTMLQKEQSLLTRTTLAKNTLSRAIGAGCPNAYTNHYPGFGKQMWYGAQKLSSYGEGFPAFPVFYSGITKEIYKPGTTGDWLITKKVWNAKKDKYETRYYLSPKNLASYKLYVYNPSVSGNTNFWTIYRRYFGSTFANPRMRPVYKFRKYSNGTYLYTTSLATRYRLRYTSAKSRWDYRGAAFSVDTSMPPTATRPVWRFKNKSTGKYSFTTSKKKYTARRTTAGRRTWAYQGVAYRVAHKDSAGAVDIYRFKNRKTGGYSYTKSKSTVRYWKTHSSFRKKWDYQGVAYYLPRAPK